MFAGDERQRLLGVGAEFLRSASLAGVIAGGNESAAERPAEIFKAAHVVALPAMEGHGDFLQVFQRAIHVHADFSVTFFRQGEGFFD